MNEYERISRQESRRIRRKWNDGWPRTGSTAYYFVEEICRVKEEGLEIVGVTTFEATKKQVKILEFKKSVMKYYIDVTIDGADEIAQDFQESKRRRCVIIRKSLPNNQKCYLIVDESKWSTT